MAHFSQDEALLSAFKNNLDVHAATAAEVLGLPVSEVTADQRRQAKAINFGLLYGMSAFGLAKQLGFSRGQAQDYIDVYFQRYPGVREYMMRTRMQALENGYVETILGRKLYTPDINNRNGMIRQAAERAAINAPLQGSAADLIKLAMIQLQAPTQAANAKMLLQVHDELIVEVAKANAAALKTQIKEVMEQVFSLTVPLVVDVGEGENWDEAH
jgi:DNA polymerase-1